MMGKAWQTVVVLLGVLAVTQQLSNTGVEAQVSGLSPDFYDDTCPVVYDIVAEGVFSAILNLTRNAASLLRLHFHDCFVQGCDASVMLAATATIPSEQTAIPNNNSLRGYQYINDIKTELEIVCPGVVSCADIIALSAFFSVILSGGPAWSIPLGRRDSLTAALPNTVVSELIAPNVNITTLKEKFTFQNLSTTDLVSLSGGHTIGIGRCTLVIPRIYNFTTVGGVFVGADPTLNTTLLRKLKANCPYTSTSTGNQTILNTPNPMDITTPTIFDNYYYVNVVEGNGLFQTDAELFDAANDTKALVQLYATNQTKFFEDFVQGMIHMGDLNVLTGTKGEIRTNCSVANSVSSVIREVVNVDSRRKSERSEIVEKTEKTVEFFQQIARKVVAKYGRKEVDVVEQLIAEAIEWGRSFI
jgi:peroxidase